MRRLLDENKCSYLYILSNNTAYTLRYGSWVWFLNMYKRFVNLSVYFGLKGVSVLIMTYQKQIRTYCIICPQIYRFSSDHPLRSDKQQIKDFKLIKHWIYNDTVRIKISFVFCMTYLINYTSSEHIFTCSCRRRKPDNQWVFVVPS